MSNKNTSTTPQTFLEKSFSFYASYHNNFINQIIHIICVWPIFFTAILFLQYSSLLPFSNLISSFIPSFLSINYSLPVLFFYFVFYLLIELPGIIGPICAIFVILTGILTHQIKEIYPNSYKIGLIIHILAWLAQFYGHGVYEGRSPALLDNLFGAIVMAPLFVTMEVAFFLGYKKDFHKRINILVKENIKEFKREQNAKKK